MAMARPKSEFRVWADTGHSLATRSQPESALLKEPWAALPLSRTEFEAAKQLQDPRRTRCAAKFDAHFERMWDAAEPMIGFAPATRALEPSGKRGVVVIAREKGGETLPFVFRSEPEALETPGKRIEVGSTVPARWDALHSRYLTKRINHQEAYSDGGTCTNDAESFLSRMRPQRSAFTTRSPGAMRLASERRSSPPR